MNDISDERNEINISDYQTGGLCNAVVSNFLSDCCYGSKATITMSFSASELLAITRALDSWYFKEQEKVFSEGLAKIYDALSAPPVPCYPYKNSADENLEIENEFKTLIFKEEERDNNVD